MGTPIEDVVGKMKEIEPMMAAKLVRHEVLFEAFVSAFMRFATEKVAVSGRSNMLYQPEFSDINKLKQMMRILENGSLFHQGRIRGKCSNPDWGKKRVVTNRRLFSINDKIPL